MAEAGAPAATAAATSTTATETVTAPASTQAPAAAAPEASDWTAGLSPELKAMVQTKGFKDPASVAESYRNLEKLMGVPQERLLKLPENIDLSTPEGRAVYEKLGAPKDAKDYSIAFQKEHADENFTNWFRETAFKNGMTQKQVEGFVGAWNEALANEAKATTEQMQAKLNDDERSLKTDWGSAFDQNINIAKQAVNTLGWKAEQIDAIESAIGYAGVMKLLHQLGTATSEHAFVGGKSAGNGIMSTEQAKAKVSEMMGDEGFRRRLLAGDADARRQWDTANKLAAPGMTTL